MASLLAHSLYLPFRERERDSLAPSHDMLGRLTARAVRIAAKKILRCRWFDNFVILLNLVRRFCAGKCRVVRQYVKRLADHRYFTRGILLAILVNTLSMGIEYHNQVCEIM